jgi:hypothetical protein
MKNVLIFASAKEIFREALLFIFTMFVFLNLYYDKTMAALVFAVLIVALQIERLADKDAN